MQYIYFGEPEELNNWDAFWMVRPLFEQISNTAQQLISQPEFVQIDWTIIRYFSPHSLKLAVWDKPEQFGWKVWHMAAPIGELLYCQPYARAKTLIFDVGLGQGPDFMYGLAT